MGMQLNYNSKITGNIDSTPVKKAVAALERDIKNTCRSVYETGISIVLEKENADIPNECFIVERNGDKLIINASSEMGLIYGIYHVSRKFLGVENFWFWNEQELVQKTEHVIPDDYHYESRPFKVRFRGWFINDEVLFDAWKPEGKDSFAWEMAFEALIRCGGNMTIPGTDFNSHKYKELANDYGLWITHHHAEPLGAQMFARAYPDLEASFDKHPDLFRGLWKDAIEDQKNCHVVWNIGFRGQGDRPFWADDPSYDTPEARGKLMSDLMMEQYNLVKRSDPDAVCCTNLYGETMELYKEGFLAFPDDVIKIWADNGFGKMVSRRQNNHNPRVYALPAEDDNSAHGIYYHASFYDLQAAAQMTMQPNSPEFVVKELQDVFAHGVDDFWIINCSNVKPHTYYLDLIADMWSTDPNEERGRSNATSECIEECDKSTSASDYAENHVDNYCRKYYNCGINENDLSKIRELYRIWPKYCIQYGPNEDDHAGEQFSNHGARILTGAFICNYNKEQPERTAKTSELDWVCQSETLLDQVRWHIDKYKAALDGYTEYLDKCNRVKELMETSECTKAAEILDDNLIWQVQYHYYSYLGAYHACKAMLTCLMGNDINERFIDVLDEGANGKEVDYITAFYEAGLSAKAFMDGYESMRGHEHDIWEGFYYNDCEADIRQSSFVMKSLMSYLRMLGDGPHFYKWQRKFQQDAGGDKVHLILRIKAHLTDDEIWELMNKKR